MSWMHAVIDVPAKLAAPAAASWSHALGWPAGSPWPGHPELVERPDGHRTRLVQVCVDSPPGLPESEVEFWRAALGWRWSGEGWVALEDPVGMVFCVTGNSPNPSTVHA